ncbi:family 43 glycosylhydrolase [Reichenbachiella ulvae]|uniref:Family 43 glycosylhydrolase n=1 Tax=Reichenbachiella ulvae TaxID=2980104 RepID=A0ABT3D0H7_9BACT|nr:family 43 glycosylhydrolase [Reichenbachiella ulvae]MCV9389303.1 family 43 glycosylhydrolase [Reichenbachiella ulvae]
MAVSLMACHPNIQSKEKKDVEQLPVEVMQHKKAIHPIDDWMRDPFITLGPDSRYYMTMTQQKNEEGDDLMPVYVSDDLWNWEKIGFPYSIRKASNAEEFEARLAEKNEERDDPMPMRLWAPEMHWVDDHWVYIHTSNTGLGNLIQTKGTDLFELKSQWGSNFRRKHDPFLFQDDDGSKYLVYKCTEIVKLKDDLSGTDGEPVQIGPSNRKMGHEGAFIIKYKGKYVLFGTAWSTDEMRHGTYNLYYCTSDNLMGPYGERKFAGRFLGHGTLFLDKQDRWWCTAFYNANKPPISPQEAKTGDQSDTAYTINKQGLTLVPMEIKMENGEVIIRPKDPDYGYPGKEEVQQF